MVVLLARNGQLCNRLFIVTAFVAHCIEHGYHLVIDSFDDYLDQFESINETCSKYHIRILTKDNKAERIYLKALGKFSYQYPKVAAAFGFVPYLNNGNINNDLFTRDALSKKLLVRGWPFWDVENFIKHAVIIRNIFRPKVDNVIKANDFIKNINTAYDVLVGVHIRRGDYINHVNGRFYFSLEIYQKKMDEVYEQLLLSGKKASFIVCSNERIENDWNVRYPYYISTMDGMTDLVLLSKCDYIFGPPSTYSMWASFYGNVPYNNFFAAEDFMEIESFSPIVAPSTFANGRVLKDVYETYSA